jgi:uncharacterized membrane protein YbhN (UPF0104 family)
MQAWFVRNRIMILTVLVIVAYAGFVEWIWGWAKILHAWQAVGFGTILAALAMLVATYVVRTHRMHDYFPQETRGQFLRLFRVTQIHNLLNIMLPLRAGETSFPLLMRSEFGIPLAHGTAALLVLRLLDLHALLAAAGIGLVAGVGHKTWTIAVWLLFLVLPLLLFPLRHAAFNALRGRLPAKLTRLMDQVDDGIPENIVAFLRAWGLTVLNWGVKVMVLAWVLRLMGIDPIAACFGGALGGELSSVLPVHAPGGVGTYPAGIAAGAAAFGISKASLAAIAEASINTHLLVIVSAVVGTGISLLLQTTGRHGGGRKESR